MDEAFLPRRQYTRRPVEGGQRTKSWGLCGCVCQPKSFLHRQFKPTALPVVRTGDPHLVQHLRGALQWAAERQPNPRLHCHKLYSGENADPRYLKSTSSLLSECVHAFTLMLSLPKEPRNLSATAISETAINVTWQHPDNPAGITEYSLTVEGPFSYDFTTVSAQQTSVVFADLQVFEDVTVNIKSCEKSSASYVCGREINTTTTTLPYRKLCRRDLKCTSCGYVRSR